MKGGRVIKNKNGKYLQLFKTYEAWIKDFYFYSHEKEQDYLKRNVLRYIEILKVVELNASKNQKVLDIGTLYGHYAIALKRLGYCVYATDIKWSGTSLLEARLKNEQIPFYICNVEDGLPFEDNFFDVIILSEVLEHLINPLKALSEIRRVLKNGGLLILTTPNFASLYNRIKLLAGKNPQAPTRLAPDGWLKSDVGWGHIHEYTLDELENLLILFDFKILIKRYLSISAKTTQKYPKILKNLYLVIVKIVPSFRDTIMIVAKMEKLKHNFHN
jgi:SAM-dependent methyltransferase